MQPDKHSVKLRVQPNILKLQINMTTLEFYHSHIIDIKEIK